ncbi:4'-phosphopantetheinyl transferase superfamily protein [Streptomyces sp. NPDC050549]|uniref:4'-phosphopantetheinyl transferase family protein n=1 Tax=Streptomyces sp. NPDC050549 TaxID=3155406 RepID=UPI00341CA97F
MTTVGPRDSRRQGFSTLAAVFSSRHEESARTAGAAGGELDVWLLVPPEPPHDVPGHELDAHERLRAGSFRRPLDRRTYVAAHVGLRRVLAVYTGIAPDRVVLAGERHDGDGGRHGRPTVLGAPGAPQFSLSHSHGLALAAVAGVRVGADVQRTPTARTVEACLPALHPAEREELLGLPEDSRPEAFGRLWTRKEAYLKGLGTGLARRPGLDCLGEAALAARPAGWLVGNLPLCAGYVGAVALRGFGDRRVAIRAVPPECLCTVDASVAVDRLGRLEPGVRSVLRDRTAGPRAD